jgi:hypothetical protein
MTAEQLKEWETRNGRGKTVINDAVGSSAVG